MPADMTQPSNVAASGSQPGVLPTPHNEYRADGKHFRRGRAPYKLPRLIIVHSTVGRDSRNWLTTTSPPPNNVSAHVLVQGNDRYNLVDFLDTAYAAGACLPGINNADTLNAEIENWSGYVARDGTVVNEPYSVASINNAAHCVAAWCYSYGIPLANVRRHADVAVYPDDYEVVALRGKLGRKHDPIAFDWHDFMNRVQAWLTFFAAIPQSEHAHYIELAQPPAPIVDKYGFIGPDTITEDVARRVLTGLGSPILAEFPLHLYLAVCAEHGINFAVALAFSYKENKCGTVGVTVPLHNWGAVRIPERAALATQRGVVMTALGQFAEYQTWLDSLRDWCLRIIGVKYLGSHPDWTVRQALQIYAPKIDPFGKNSPNDYADEVQRLCAAWEAESAIQGGPPSIP